MTPAIGSKPVAASPALPAASAAAKPVRTEPTQPRAPPPEPPAVLVSTAPARLEQEVRLAGDGATVDLLIPPSGIPFARVFGDESRGAGQVDMKV